MPHESTESKEKTYQTILPARDLDAYDAAIHQLVPDESDDIGASEEGEVWVSPAPHGLARSECLCDACVLWWKQSAAWPNASNASWRRPHAGTEHVAKRQRGEPCEVNHASSCHRDETEDDVDSDSEDDVDDESDIE